MPKLIKKTLKSPLINYKVLKIDHLSRRNFVEGVHGDPVIRVKVKVSEIKNDSWIEDKVNVREL